ncbi:MAG: hypothetical protein WA836_14825 [Candidatus Binataceae bacterium]
MRAYHHHFQENGWCFDVMARSQSFCTKRLNNQRWQHRDPDEVLLTACADGIELKDDRGIIRALSTKAKGILDTGPDPLSANDILRYRSEITEALDDFVDAKSHAEARFVAHQTTILASRLLLGYNRRWSNEEPKWVYRNINNYNHELARELLNGLDRYWRTDDRAELAGPIESILNLVGGKLYRDEVDSVAYPSTIVEQFVRHPIHFMRKAVPRLRRALS